MGFQGDSGGSGPGRPMDREIVMEAKPKPMLFIPLKGWSLPGDEGRSFYDPAIMEVFERQLKRFVRADQLISVDLSVNDPKFGLLASNTSISMESRWEMSQ